MVKGSANIVSLALLVVAGAGAAICYFGWGSIGWAAGVAVAGLLLAGSPRLINEWERGVLLRLGRYQQTLTPGVTWVMPGIDVIKANVDMRIRSTAFSAEKTLTKDTVPVNVDAVLFWVVTDARRAVLEVEHYERTVSWAAQTTLRDVIGKSDLLRMISDRESLDKELQSIIDAKTSEWGVTVQSVEIRDVRLPNNLEDAMSRMAQADREKEARVVLAQAEQKVAQQMQQAARIYHDDPIALRLRAMNMTYESIKEKGALMVVPSGMVESLNSNVLGLAAAGFSANGERS